jgi:hypothetical protein
MARVAKQSLPNRTAPKTPLEVKTFEHVRRVFGRHPKSIRPLLPGVRQANACIVKMSDDEDSMEFICVDGLLFQFPLKRS